MAEERIGPIVGPVVSKVACSGPSGFVLSAALSPGFSVSDKTNPWTWTSSERCTDKPFDMSTEPSCLGITAACAHKPLAARALSLLVAVCGSSPPIKDARRVAAKGELEFREIAH